jgi:hypothetical protein
VAGLLFFRLARWHCKTTMNQHKNTVPLRRLIIASSRIGLLNVFILFDWNQKQTFNGREWKTLLCISAEDEVVERLLAKTDIDVNLGDKTGCAPILLAA